MSSLEDQCCRFLGSNHSFDSILVESVTDTFKLYRKLMQYIKEGSGRLFVHSLAERLQGKLKPCRLLGKVNESTLREPRNMNLWSSTCRVAGKQWLQNKHEKWITMNCGHQTRLQRLTSFSFFSDMLCADSMTVGITVQMPFLHIRVGSSRHHCKNANQMP